jgi:flagellar biosynthetic protein FliR
MPSEVALSLPTLFGFLRALARATGVLAFLPLPGIRNVPDMARIVLALAISICLAPVWPILGADMSDTTSLGAVVAVVAMETAFGLATGVVVSFLTESFQIGAQILGLQAGYSYASTIDPNSQADSSVLQLLAQMIAAVLFFTLGFDREVIRALAESMRNSHAGARTLSLPAAEAVIRAGADMLMTAVRIALPVVALLLMVDIALALLGRMQAQLQLLTVAFPAKMLAALAVLAAVLVVLPHVFDAAGRRSMAVIARIFGI